MRDPRIDKFADSIVNYSCRVQPGEKVLIETYDETPDDLVKAVIRSVYAAGGIVYTKIYKMDIRREMLLGATHEQLEMAGDIDDYIFGKMDVSILISGEENLCETNDVPSERMADFSSVRSRVVRGHRPHLKWVVMYYPTQAMAQAEGMSMEEFEDAYFNICSMDYARMKKAYEPLKALMERTDRVRLTGRGTDLTFSIKGIPAVPCAGENNIPDGECYTAPVRDSVNGVITYNTRTFYDGIPFANIRFVFRDGKIVEATSSDTARLNEILDRHEGNRYIGEFAIGVNPYITKPWVNSMFNEKMTGSIHFTPGNTIESASNGNRGSIHWDIVLAQTPEYGGGEIWFDGVLVRKDGRFVLPELECLNPENLI